MVQKELKIAPLYSSIAVGFIFAPTNDIKVVVTIAKLAQMKNLKVVVVTVKLGFVSICWAFFFI